MGGALGPALRLDDEPAAGTFISLDVARDADILTLPEASTKHFVASGVKAVGDDLAARDVSMRRASGLYATKLKPGIDAVCAPVIALLALPLCLAIACLLRVTMGRGVLFRQKRVGKDGEVFEVVKFRTMRHDRRQRQQPIDFPDRRTNHKHPDDPRHTSVGRFLRSTSLDELPQLLNVMRGEMSLIGPRPELLDLVEQYPEWLHARHAVRPGMTGLWQVSARGEKSMQDCLDIDLDYVEQVSVWLDLRTALATPIAALGKRRGA